MVRRSVAPHLVLDSNRAPNGAGKFLKGSTGAGKDNGRGCRWGRDGFNGGKGASELGGGWIGVSSICCIPVA